MTLRKINIFLFLLIHFLSFSQTKEKITIKQQDQIYFYRLGKAKDSIIVKSKSDLFHIKMSDDNKKIIEIKLKNATFVRTTQENIYKLIYTPGMRYRMVYYTFINESSNGSKNNRSTDPIKEKPAFPEQIDTDGANVDGTKEIVIELIDTKKEKVIITNTFTYKEK